tara:strand:- start:2795 stop:3043 length:249 start_codon:yes stop_codon:yes gene_type:complete
MKAYLLQHYVNDYNQHGAYTLAVFKDKPDFHKVKSTCLKLELEISSSGKTLDAIYGALSRMEGVTGYGNGGDSWVIEEVGMF